MGAGATKEEIAEKLDELDKKEIEVNLKLKELQIRLNNIVPDEEKIKVNDMLTDDPQTLIDIQKQNAALLEECVNNPKKIIDEEEEEEDDEIEEDEEEINNKKQSQEDVEEIEEVEVEEEEIPKQNIQNNELQLSFNLSKRKKYENINEEIPPATNAQTPKKLDETNNEVLSSFEKDKAWLIEIGEIIESKKDLFQNAQTINENVFTEISELVGKIVEIFFSKYKNLQLNITPDIILLGQNIKNGIKSISNERNFLKNEHFITFTLHPLL